MAESLYVIPGVYSQLIITWLASGRRRGGRWVRMCILKLHTHYRHEQKNTMTGAKAHTCTVVELLPSTFFIVSDRGIFSCAEGTAVAHGAWAGVSYKNIFLTRMGRPK